jgi:cellulose synthase/poly-beta-1,6-N-acetylglucosamine synthase-like glycosyltransferase
VAAVLSFVLVTFAGLSAIPILLFCIEVVAAVVMPQREFKLSGRGGLRPRIAALVPAHNESGALLHTIEDIKKQLRAGDRLLVVADNCTDDTAAIARAAGAEVAERHDPAKIGKGYALDWGLRHLAADPPGVVVVIDADCRLADDTLDRLTTACATTHQPVQALNLMVAPDKSTLDYRAAMFAFRIKNWVRPLGLGALGLPCQLMGTGMAFPWDVIRSINLATELEVEDLKLGLDLTRAGHPPLFCPLASVESHFPSSIRGAKSQRKRWEQGHIGIIGTAIPRLIYHGFARGDVRLLALALDAAAPPLTVLGMLATLMLVLSISGVLLGLSAAALAVSAISLSMFVFAVFLCWLKFGRDILPPTAFPSVLFYVAGKMPLYRQMLSRGSHPRWIRTDRAKIGTDSISSPE